jgi:transposase
LAQLANSVCQTKSRLLQLIESAKLDGVNPQRYLADVLARIADHPARRIAELLPWNWQPLQATRAAA